MRVADTTGRQGVSQAIHLVVGHLRAVAATVVADVAGDGAHTLEDVVLRGDEVAHAGDADEDDQTEDPAPEGVLEQVRLVRHLQHPHAGEESQTPEGAGHADEHRVATEQRDDADHHQNAHEERTERPVAGLAADVSGAGVVEVAADGSAGLLGIPDGVQVARAGACHRPGLFGIFAVGLVGVGIGLIGALVGSGVIRHGRDEAALRELDGARHLDTFGRVHVGVDDERERDECAEQGEEHRDQERTRRGAELGTGLPAGGVGGGRDLGHDIFPSVNGFNGE